MVIGIDVTENNNVGLGFDCKVVEIDKNGKEAIINSKEEANKKKYDIKRREMRKFLLFAISEFFIQSISPPIVSRYSTLFVFALALSGLYALSVPSCLFFRLYLLFLYLNCLVY